MKYIKIIFFTVFFIITTAVLVTFAHSPLWYQEDGHWRVRGADGNPIKNACFVDDHDSDINTPEYFFDSSGNMVIGVINTGLDAFGRDEYIFCNAEPGEHYGEVVTKDGYYGGFYLEFTSEGRFASQDVLNALIQKYGLTEVDVQDTFWDHSLVPIDYAEEYRFFDEECVINSEKILLTKEEIYSILRQSLDEFGFINIEIIDAAPILEKYYIVIPARANLSFSYKESRLIFGRLCYHENAEKYYDVGLPFTPENLNKVLAYAAGYD